MIEVGGLTKLYGDRKAIHNLNFKIDKGQVVGFLGPNGAGKSTTMKIITGFMAPTKGFAKVGGIDVFENPIEVKKKIGYLPETPPVYNDMYVKDYLKYVAELKGVEKSKINKFVDVAIEKTNLGSVQNRLIHNLSKGYKQRVGISQALVSDPDVLILDEPTVGLDPKQVAEIRDLIKELKGYHTIILSTHILPEVQATCERIIIINQGQIVAQDSLENLSKITSGSRRLKLKLKQKVQESVFKNLQGLHAVTLDESNDWILDVQDTDEAVSLVSEFVVKSGYGLLELTRERADLEDVFLKLTYGASPTVEERL